MAALGIDLGTTSVKVCIVEAASKDVLQSTSENTQATVCSSHSFGHEQSAPLILNCLQTCMSRLSRQHLSRVATIGVCGQMHGCVLWSSTCKAKDAGSETGAESTVSIADGALHLNPAADMSSLYTWEDGRCEGEFLDSLPKPSSPIPISTGYGNATIAWLHRFARDEVCRYDSAGTIMDLVTCGLTGHAKPNMSAQNAASWGYFNPATNHWDVDILNGIGFPVHLLPEVTPPGCVRGSLSSAWNGIPAGAMVTSSLGDMQCSVLSSLGGRKEGVAVLNMGTSGQLVVLADAAVPRPPLPPSLLHLPFFEQTSLIAAASLNGGNVLQVLVSMLEKWCSDLGVHPASQNETFTRLNEKAKAYSIQHSPVASTPSCQLTISPTLFGERHASEKRGVVSGITPTFPELGEVFWWTCWGLLDNLLAMMSRAVLDHYKVTEMLGCGSTLQRNHVLQAQVSKVFSLPLTMTSSNADVGAALASLNCSKPV